MFLIPLFLIFQISLNEYTDQDLNIEIQTLHMLKKTPITMHRCLGFVVNSNYRRVELLINAKQIDNIIVTDKLIEQDCSQAVLSNCPTNSTFCINSKKFKGSTKMSIGKCLNEFYIYFYTLNFQGGDLTAQYSTKAGCDNIPENEFTNCASIPINQCGMSTNSKCNKKCVKLECIFTDQTKNNQSYLRSCIPYSVPKQKFNEYCNHQYYYHSAIKKHPVAYHCDKQEHIPDESEEEEQQQEQQLHRRQNKFQFWDIFSYILIILISAFILSVIWYRTKLSKTGIAPFNPPKWVPEWIYPRERQENIFEQQKQKQKEMSSYHKI